MLRHIPARPEQTASLSTIVRDALRAAALAPDLSSALDIAGGALVDIAAVARGERQPSTSAEEAPSGPAVSVHHDDRFRLARAAADQALTTLDRLGSILEAIQRCARDSDMAIEDLATVGREIAQAEAERLDVTFTQALLRSVSTEVGHG